MMMMSIINPPTNYPSLPIRARLARCGANEEKNEFVLPGGLQQGLMPKHVAVIMDGNRRWAINKGLPPQNGYGFGAKAMKELARSCSKFGLQVLSVYAFSADNWARPKEEIDHFLLNVLEENVIQDINELMQKENMQAHYVGNKRHFSETLEKKLFASNEHGKTNTGMHFLFCLDYSGQYDIIEATKKIANKVKDGVFQEDDIDPTLFEQHLVTHGLQYPNPDLVIRTSGELRLSNFMLWQLAYTEMFFIDKMFPDFDEKDLVQALIEFQRRKRRFGGHNY